LCVNGWRTFSVTHASLCVQTFVAQNEDDYRVLNQLNDQQHFINGRQRVRINTISITPEDIQSITPYPAPREQVSRL
jgi:hypothetical protein